MLKRCAHENGQFISPIFCVPKKDGKIRLILNLKQLNSFVAYHHFKMETIQSILAMITPNCWMASIDLKDAYYSVRIHPSCQRYLKFCYEGSVYAYTAYPNGLASCPRQFTKLLKPPVAELRSQGHIIASYIDDIYLQSDTYRGGSRIFGDYSSNLLGSEPRPPCLRDTPTIWANDKPCVFIVVSYS